MSSASSPWAFFHQQLASLPPSDLAKAIGIVLWDIPLELVPSNDEARDFIRIIHKREDSTACRPAMLDLGCFIRPYRPAPPSSFKLTGPFVPQRN